MLDNIFIDEATKEVIFNGFSEIQRKFHLLYRFCMRIKYYLLERFRLHNSTDLLGNTIKLGDKSCIGICQIGTLFLFSRRDLLQLFNSSLGYSKDFFNKPLHIMNPYNRIFFTKLSLQNMYWFLKDGDLPISSLIHGFSDCQFNLHTFEKQNSYILREYAINSFMKNASKDDKLEYIQDMLHQYNKSKCQRLFIPDDYINDSLIEDCKSHLHKYLICMYSLRSGKSILRKEWLREFGNFISVNNRFGTRIVFRQLSVDSDSDSGSETEIYSSTSP
jgi:hypothetical protein